MISENEIVTIIEKITVYESNLISPAPEKKLTTKLFRPTHKSVHLV